MTHQFNINELNEIERLREQSFFTEELILTKINSPHLFSLISKFEDKSEILDLIFEKINDFSEEKAIEKTENLENTHKELIDIQSDVTEKSIRQKKVDKKGEEIELSLEMESYFSNIRESYASLWHILRYVGINEDLEKLIKECSVDGSYDSGIENLIKLWKVN